MTARRFVTILVLTLALGGCSEDTPPEVSSTPAASTEATTTQQAGQPTVAIPTPASAPGATPAPGTPAAPGLPGVTGPGGQRVDLGGLQRAIGQATEAASAAGGDTNCERAYNGIIAMVEVMQKAAGRAGNAAHRPARERFLLACSELPPQIQQCMVIGYGMQHQQECREARNALTPEMQTRMQQVMSGGAHGGEGAEHESDDDDGAEPHSDGDDHEGEGH